MLIQRYYFYIFVKPQTQFSKSTEIKIWISKQEQSLTVDFTKHLSPFSQHYFIKSQLRNYRLNEQQNHIVLINIYKRFTGKTLSRKAVHCRIFYMFTVKITKAAAPNRHQIRNETRRQNHVKCSNEDFVFVQKKVYFLYFAVTNDKTIKHII